MYSESKFDVRYAETDQMGIVHHSVYPIWYEAGRTDFTKKLNMTYAQMEREGVMTPLVELTSQYKKPAHYGDTVMVRTSIQKLTPARIIFYYEVYRGEELLATGTTMHAWTGRNLKPMNLKKHRPDLYEMMEKTMETK